MTQKVINYMCEIRAEISDLLIRNQNVNIYLEGLRKVGDIFTDFEVSTWHALVDFVKVMTNKTLEFHMRDGSTMSVSMDQYKRR